MSNSRSTPDHFTRRAKKEGHPARSVYKLEEMDRRWKLLRRGAHVLDLGCAPGSWLKYAAEKVGPSGHVLGFDLKPVDIALPPHAEARVGDAFDIAANALGSETYDVVLSDMAPSTMGNHRTDAARSAALVEQALALAEHCLRPGGNVVVKILEGGEVVQIVQGMRTRYQKVERLRPDATRKSSTEIFLIGLGLKKP